MNYRIGKITFAAILGLMSCDFAEAELNKNLMGRLTTLGCSSEFDDTRNIDAAVANLGNAGINVTGVRTVLLNMVTGFGKDVDDILTVFNVIVKIQKKIGNDLNRVAKEVLKTLLVYDVAEASSKLGLTRGEFGDAGKIGTSFKEHIIKHFMKVDNFDMSAEGLHSCLDCCRNDDEFTLVLRAFIDANDFMFENVNGRLCIIVSANKRAWECVGCGARKEVAGTIDTFYSGQGNKTSYCAKCGGETIHYASHYHTGVYQVPKSWDNKKHVLYKVEGSAGKSAERAKWTQLGYNIIDGHLEYVSAAKGVEAVPVRFFFEFKIMPRGNPRASQAEGRFGSFYVAVER